MDLSTIQRRIASLEKVQQETRINREMIKGELENDERYLEAASEVKAAAQKRKQLKDEILGTGPNQEISANIKNQSEEIATLKEILSAELSQYYEEKKTDEIPDDTGATRKFKVMAHLLPKKTNWDKRNGMGQFDGKE